MWACMYIHRIGGVEEAAPKVRKYQIYPWLYAYFVFDKLLCLITPASFVEVEIHED